MSNMQNSFKQAILKSKNQEFHEKLISHCNKFYIFEIFYSTRITSRVKILTEPHQTKLCMVRF